MDACIVTSGTGNAFPKDTGNSQLIIYEYLGTERRRPLQPRQRDSFTGIIIPCDLNQRPNHPSH